MSSPEIKLNSHQDTHRTLVLRAGESRRVRRGHPWVYSNEIDNARTPLLSGAAFCRAIISFGKRYPRHVFGDHGLEFGSLCCAIEQAPATMLLHGAAVPRKNSPPLWA